MSILLKLKEDHDKVKKILESTDKFFEKFPKVNEEQEKVYMEKLLKELEPHSKAEEKVFYQALRKKKEESLCPYEGVEEHALALQVLMVLQKGSLDKPKRTAKIKVLKDILIHHIEEEESKYFKEAKEVFNPEELETLGEKFEEEKKKIIQTKTA